MADDAPILDAQPALAEDTRTWWKAARPWIKRTLGLFITVLIFAWIIKPIYQRWDLVGHRILEINWWRILGASLIFAAFLFVFRALVWRRLLKSFGHKLPVWAATRIWSTSELARYLPGSIWQIVGRVYLSKPYGVRGTAVTTSQIMELALFLLANLMVAVGALAFFVNKLDVGTRVWVVIAATLVPLLSVMLHPTIFYGITDRVLKRLGKPLIENRMRWKSLIELLLWKILGLLVQGLAIYLVVSDVLKLAPSKWWIVAGAYCLAWCAGFLAFWAPGGLGVREAVFIAAMSFAMKRAIRHEQASFTYEERYAFLAFLSVLLRIWATIGELILCGLAHLLDRSRPQPAAEEPAALTDSPPAAVAEQNGLGVTSG
jgi:uncharacterized membrane protein YbhN (UPF0104 family)